MFIILKIIILLKTYPHILSLSLNTMRKIHCQKTQPIFKIYYPVFLHIRMRFPKNVLMMTNMWLTL